MGAKHPRHEITLASFLDGVLSVMAFRERRRVPLQSGVFEPALVATMEALDKQADREKLRFGFRVPRDALKRKTSALWKTFRGLEKAGVVRIVLEPTPTAELLPTPDAAYGRLSGADLPVGFLERAANLLHQRLQVAKIRSSLAQITAQRREAQR